MDTIHYCDHYNKQGYCSDERFIDYMTRNCPKTCGMCEPGMVESVVNFDWIVMMKVFESFWRLFFEFYRDNCAIAV